MLSTGKLYDETSGTQEYPSQKSKIYMYAVWWIVNCTCTLERAFVWHNFALQYTLYMAVSQLCVCLCACVCVCVCVCVCTHAFACRYHAVSMVRIDDRIIQGW